MTFRTITTYDSFYNITLIDNKLITIRSSAIISVEDNYLINGTCIVTLNTGRELYVKGTREQFFEDWRKAYETEAD